ncbi:F-actin-uncapping protein LRRC16A isoform X2 [Culicoides brevitarsis]|uniref:F-actin-uncapping protein LRRC16A isoform X2 n=1 Tax=Culicoides brevitarsis TaxID=469753 RepID=UPI00307B741E
MRQGFKMSTRSQITKDLNESIKSVLGRHTKILVKYMVKLEYKTDKTENRVLVFTPVRVYLLTAKVPTRIDQHFHYLDIQGVESKVSTRFSIQTTEKTYNFCSIGDAGNFASSADVILTDLSSSIKQIFPTVPLNYIIKKIVIEPCERISIFSDELRTTDPKTVGPCGGFSQQYACLCDYHGVPYREEVAWDIDTIYLSHDNKILNLKDFDHLESKDLMAIVSVLEYNTFFRGLKIKQTKVSSETLDRILHVLKRSMWLEELHLEALGLKSDFIHKLALSVMSNKNSALRTIDLSHNPIEDKGAVHLTGSTARISKGLCKLALSHCGITSKGVNQIAQSLTQNQSIANSLTHLDLSGNSLKDDINNLYNFLAQPNVLEELDISSTDTALESFFGALLRGCSTHLCHLNVSHNYFSTKKGKEIPPSFKQFFTSTLCLKHLNISHCKLPLEALKHLLLGLACNESTIGLHLNLSCNNLGPVGAHVLESCIHGVRVLQSLDISENNLDAELATVITAIGKNPSIRCLRMNKSFLGMKPKYYSVVMDALVNLVQKDDIPLQELVLSENKLKNDLHNFINALGSNQTLQILDISGNFMGDIGARLLAKALQINNKLKTIYMDRNNVSLQGYADIVYALENNYSMRHIPFPLFDIAPTLKNHPERTDAVMRKMQEYLRRNSMGIKRSNGQGFRLQHGFLLSSTHQLIDKLVSETNDSISLKQNESSTGIQRLLEDAENCKQLLPRLQEAVRAETHPIEMKMNLLTQELGQCIKIYLDETLETMIRTGVEQCPKTLGNPTTIAELRTSCNDRLNISDEFLQACVIQTAGSEIINKVNEIEQNMASTIADRATDEVLEALTRYKRGLGIPENDSPYDDTLVSDIVRSQSSHDAFSINSMKIRAAQLPIINLGSPTQLEYLNLATPQLRNKARPASRKIRPQSVVGIGVTNLSIDHIPRMLENFRRDSKDSQEENCDSITELPSTSQQLQHLVKNRPKKAKTRAPTRPFLAENATQSIGEGLEAFFRPGSTTPSTLTPVMSPTSEECTFPSIDSPTLSAMSRDENGHLSNVTSGETTPIMDERKGWTTRSRSTDNIEKSPAIDRKSPRLVKLETVDGPHSFISLDHRAASKISPNEDALSELNHKINNNGICKTPSRPRPWSVVGNESKDTTTGNDSSHHTTPDELDNDVDVVPFVGNTPGSSIVGISPGLALSGGGSVVGLGTPGTAFEKRSVRDMAANFQKLDTDTVS